MKRPWHVGTILATICLLAGQAIAEGNAAKGERLFNGFLRCYACHSLEPGITKVGPSLAWLFGRAAGTADGFDGYSDAIKTSGVIWYENTLNEFLADPQKFIPGNRMAMDGYFASDVVSSAQNRADIIAYLEKATKEVNY